MEINMDRVGITVEEDIQINSMLGRALIADFRETGETLEVYCNKHDPPPRIRKLLTSVWGMARAEVQNAAIFSLRRGLRANGLEAIIEQRLDALRGAFENQSRYVEETFKAMQRLTEEDTLDAGELRQQVAKLMLELARQLEPGDPGCIINTIARDAVDDVESMLDA